MVVFCQTILLENYADFSTLFEKKEKVAYLWKYLFSVFAYPTPTLRLERLSFVSRQININCFSSLIGWEPGTQYVYKYVGRSIAGIYKFKLQNAIIELRSRVIIQSIDENTLIVKVLSL